MIEIIKFGHIKTTKCKECGCLFKYHDKDDTTVIEDVVFSTDIRHSIEKRVIINCPQCNHEILLEATR